MVETYHSIVVGCFIWELRERHRGDVLTGRRKYVPLRRLGDVPLRRRWVFHLRPIWDVVKTYWWGVVISSSWDVVTTYQSDTVKTFHWDIVGCFTWDVHATSLGRTKRLRYDVGWVSTCDAKSLYANISLDLFLTAIEYSIELLRNNIPLLQRFTKQFILKGWSIIWKFNYFYIEKYLCSLN